MLFRAVLLRRAGALRAVAFLRPVVFRAVLFLRAGDLRAVDFLRAVVFLRAGLLRAVLFLRAVDLRAVDFLRAGLLRAVLFFRPVVLRAVLFLRAGAFRAVVLRPVDFRAAVLRPVDFLRPVVFFAAKLSTSLSTSQDQLRSRFPLPRDLSCMHAGPSYNECALLQRAFTSYLGMTTPCCSSINSINRKSFTARKSAF